MVAYGIAAANLALIVPNAVAILVISVTIGVAARYRRPPYAWQDKGPRGFWTAREPARLSVYAATMRRAIV